MKLFGPNYGRGQSSVGRDPTDPTAVSRAEFAAATSETGVGSAIANAGEAYARSGAVMANAGDTMVRTGNIMLGEITAKKQIAAALHQTADVFDTWDKAADSVRQNAGIARYVEGTTKLMDDIKTQPTVKAASLPSEWLKKDEDREDIPTWEVAQKIWDTRERELYTDAMSKVTRIENRAELDRALMEKRVSGAAQVRNLHITEQKKDWLGQNEESIKKFIQANDAKSAVDVVERGFKLGMYNAVERVQKTEKILHDAEDLNTAKLIANTEAPSWLRKVADGILNKEGSRLTPDEKRSYANQALAKADHIAKQDEIIRQKQERDASKKVMGDLGEKIRFHGYIPTHQDLVEAQRVLTPTDYLALLKLVDTKDGNGTVKSDPAVMRDLNNQILGLGKPDSSGIPADQRANMVMDNVTKAYIDGKLEHKDREWLTNTLEKHRDRALKKNPEHTQAENLIESNLLPPKGFLQTLTAGELTRFGAVSDDMKIALNEATRKDPRLDPIKWVKDNLPQYKARNESVVYETLFNLGLGAYFAPGADKYDSIATRANLDQARRDKLISDALYVRAVNELGKLGQPVSSTKKKGTQQ